MTVWVLILLSSICSILVAHLLKVTETARMDTLRMLTVNYFTAAAIALFPFNSLAVMEPDGLHLPLAGLLLLTGVLFIGNFFIFSKSVDRNGIGITVAAMRVSLILPVLLSAFWYHESLSARQWSGIIIVFLTLYLLLPERNKLWKQPVHISWLLLLLFFFTGTGDSALKIYEADFSDRLSIRQFLGTVFLISSLAGSLLILLRRAWRFSRREVGTGIAVGIPNLFAAFFLIEALSHLSGGIVYALVNLLTVLGATLLGIVRWGDRLTAPQWAGLVLALIAIVLMI